MAKLAGVLFDVIYVEQRHNKRVGFPQYSKPKQNMKIRLHPTNVTGTVMAPLFDVFHNGWARSPFSGIVHNMAADNMVTQGAWSSVSMALT